MTWSGAVGWERNLLFKEQCKAVVPHLKCDPGLWFIY